MAKTATSSAGKLEKFDISKNIHFVPLFQDTEVDKYFLQFDKIASSLEWPKEAWTLLLQSVLLCKAREVYSALSVDQSANYDAVRGVILTTYKLVLETYLQKFCGWRKEESQMYAGFVQTKENLFDLWFTANDIGGEFAKLHQLMLNSKVVVQQKSEHIWMMGKQRIYIKLQFGQMTAHSLIGVYLRKYSQGRLKLQTSPLENTI